ncbi:hypothetical protein [Mycolicibacterium frederiksbergense]|uniref:hypothetical protein n=1 Tax=Mycolicibacterium frederiksbergense TaxID=117567 RepID=UPI0024746683|nr:hypothetical protein [Mycolicibacterium frederiksbergense]
MGEIAKFFIDAFLGWVAKALGAIEILGWKPFEWLVEWRQNLDAILADVKDWPLIGDLIEAITGVEDGDLNDLGTFFLNVRNFLASINFLDPAFNPITAVTQFVNLMLLPLNIFANLVGGLLNGAWIPGLDASKIVTGLFSIGRINGLQVKLDDLDTTIAAIPGAQGLIDKICNALGVSGTGHTVTDVYNALFHIPGPNIGSPIGAINVPGIDASKIISGSIAQTFLNIVSIPGSIVAGLLSGKNIPILDQTKVDGLGAIAANASAAQGNWTSWLSGGSWADINASVADFLGTKETANTADATATTAHATAWGTITRIYNNLGGNNAESATQAQADGVLAGAAALLSRHSAQISDLLSRGDVNGFREVVTFRQPETAVFDVAGNYTPTLPMWFNHATDSLDVPVLGGGGGGGGGLTDSSGAGTDTVFRVAGVAKATGVGGASVGSGTGSHPKGWGPGNRMLNDILYEGGGEAPVGAKGRSPGGGGGAGDWFSVQGKGGNAGSWGTVTLGPGAATGALSLTVGAGGAGTATGFGAADGADGCAWLRAQAGMPAAFTSMGTLLLPTYKLNTGVALTDAMTAAATWSRVPPNGASGGHILIIRANSAFTSYVYLWVKTVSGVTNYELGRVSSGTKSAWKTGTLGDAVPFNAFSLTSDDGYIYTISVNGTPFDSYNDTTHASSLGASYRSGGWGSSDSASPGSIIQFGFLDTGTPSRITSNTIATSQGTSSAAYVDLATVGPSVTIVVPPSGEVVVDISAEMATTALTAQTGFVGIAVSGANTMAAADTRCARGTWAGASGLGGTLSNRFHYTGLTRLTPGTTTFKAVYKSSSGTVNFANRNIIVKPEP